MSGVCNWVSEDGLRALCRSQGLREVERTRAPEDGRTVVRLRCDAGRYECFRSISDTATEQLSLYDDDPAGGDGGVVVKDGHEATRMGIGGAVT